MPSDDIKSTPGDNNNDSSDNHQIPEVPEVKESGEDEDQFTNPTASPAVTDGEAISSDAPSGEPQDIDKALSDMGLDNDADGVKPLSSDDIDD